MVKKTGASLKHKQAKGEAKQKTSPPQSKETKEPKAKEVLAEKPEGPRIRIRLKAFDHKIIDESARIIVEMAERTGAEVRGPVPLPTEIRKYTVNRSTFVHKDSREQFEMRTHKRLIDIVTPTSKTIDGLTSLNLPSGVDVEVKM